MFVNLIIFIEGEIMNRILWKFFENMVALAVVLGFILGISTIGSLIELYL